MQITFDDDVHWHFDRGMAFVWANVDRDRIRCDLTQEAISKMPLYRTASASDMQRDMKTILEDAKAQLRQKIETGQLEMIDGVRCARILAKDVP